MGLLRQLMLNYTEKYIAMDGYDSTQGPQAEKKINASVQKTCVSYVECHSSLKRGTGRNIQTFVL